jgi:4-methyl-5(b-hydroxyethyl)-thiazole monophosphate biosynthesis
VLDGKRATAFPGTLNAQNFPRVGIAADAVLTDGRVVTSRGPGTAMDFALELVELLAGRDERVQVEAALQRPAEHMRRTD